MPSACIARSTAFHATIAEVLRIKAKAGNRSHVAAGANWSMPATVHVWKSYDTVKVLIGNLESWWWDDAEPTIAFTPDTARAITLYLDYRHLGLARPQSPAGC